MSAGVASDLAALGLTGLPVAVYMRAGESERRLLAAAARAGLKMIDTLQKNQAAYLARLLR